MCEDLFGDGFADMAPTEGIDGLAMSQEELDKPKPAKTHRATSVRSVGRDSKRSRRTITHSTKCAAEKSGKVCTSCSFHDTSQDLCVPTETRLWGQYKWVGELLVTDGTTCWYDVKAWCGAGNGPNKGMTLTKFKEMRVADAELNDYCLKLILYMVQDRDVLLMFCFASALDVYMSV